MSIAQVVGAQGTAPARAGASAPAAATPTAKPAALPLLAVPAVALPGAASTPAATAPAAATAPLAAASAPAETASMPAMVSAALTPGAPSSAPVAGTIDGRIQDVKADVIKLNRDLLVLEEELLFPANTQVALFVSMDVGVMFQLDSVQIKLDDKVVANYLYTQLEVDALHRGGVQRVYLGNLKTGQHELVAFFTGKGPHERNYRRGANVKFEKTTEAKYIELRIQDSTGKLQPEFDIKLWQ
ncbi:MAG TPA: AraC family transcriptional regulator [Caldimonas sp.]|nr:AraC family transcriptional regulator [Caldimonas sp.]